MAAEKQPNENDTEKTNKVEYHDVTAAEQSVNGDQGFSTEEKIEMGTRSKAEESLALETFGEVIIVAKKRRSWNNEEGTEEIVSITGT